MSILIVHTCNLKTIYTATKSYFLVYESFFLIKNDLFIFGLCHCARPGSCQVAGRGGGLMVLCLPTKQSFLDCFLPAGRRRPKSLPAMTPKIRRQSKFFVSFFQQISFFRRIFQKIL